MSGMQSVYERAFSGGHGVIYSLGEYIRRAGDFMKRESKHYIENSELEEEIRKY